MSTVRRATLFGALTDHIFSSKPNLPILFAFLRENEFKGVHSLKNNQLRGIFRVFINNEFY